MKKLLIIGLIVLFSCEDKEICYRCTTETQQWNHKKVMVNFTICGYDNMRDTIGVIETKIDTDYTLIETVCYEK